MLLTLALLMCGMSAWALSPRQQLQEQALGLAQSPAEREALTFLYKYMAWPDVADYTPQFHAAQVRCAVRARQELPWGQLVPDREWRHFVLPVRVNNEHLDSFRTTCYEELRQRVQGLSMREAALEVNHWCHEYVTYKPSDARTSSPLASMRTAYGRCGEESTFTVSALRAVGIPARQVYTPRWAHTDDNHAWVECWVEGEWYFLGACEPEAVLNLAWFNQPASRGMMMHTKVFGLYDGPEDKVSYTPTYTEINVTSNYAQTARTWVVTEPGATVEFKLYNYGEFYTVYRTTADKDGRASIQSGLGDMIVWCSKDGRYGLKQVSPRTLPLRGGDAPQGAEGVFIPLDHKQGDTWSADFTLTPPAGGNNLPAVTPEATALNEQRKAHEDSIRTAYVATFPQTQDELITQSRGNWRSMERLLQTYGQAARALLSTLSEKDLRDFDYDVIAHHMERIDRQLLVEDKLYAQYVACPRISTEHLSAWRQPLAAAFTPKQKEQFRLQPERLAQWLRKQIVTDTEWNPAHAWLSPERSMEFRLCDVRNKGLLFVAAARSMGIFARIDEVTGQVQYADPATPPFGGEPKWVTVDMADTKADTKAAAATASLSLSYTPRQYMENPGYYYHFTLSQLQGGRPRLLEYGEEDTWQDNFATPRPIDQGDYILVSGTRMASGSVLAHVEAFTVGQGTTTVPLTMREDKTGVQVIGNFNSENLYQPAPHPAEVSLPIKGEVAVRPEGVRSILSHTGRGYYVCGLIRANHEPTNHILHDLEKQRAALEAWGRPLLLCFPTAEEYARFLQNSAEFTNLPSTLSFGIDAEGQIARDLFGGTLVKTEELPIVFIGDTFNRVVFCSQGYTIGMGEKIIQTISKL
ncbi:MAG: transglutaminase domain-containing protein [Bacteroidaceae bacterium]|nr:transglutaminase domain-containing protein [Bacteroidaceae bacterium]